MSVIEYLREENSWTIETETHRVKSLTLDASLDWLTPH